jgi:hypothetical protein
MKLKHMTPEALSAEIVKQVRDRIPQVTLEVEPDTITRKGCGFHNILQCGQRVMWFNVNTVSKNHTILEFVIAIQDENYEIRNHSFLKLASVDDMIELINYNLKLNGRL